jgi:hypothetical protein
MTLILLPLSACQVKGSTDSTAHLSRDSRILLRADTIFRRRDLPPDPENDYRSQYGLGAPRVDNSLQYYPKFVSSDSHFFEYSWSEDNVEEDPRNYETNLDNYDRYIKAENVVKPLLRELGMPDAAWAELELMNRRFTCGRCVDKMPKTWGELVSLCMSASFVVLALITLGPRWSITSRCLAFGMTQKPSKGATTLVIQSSFETSTSSNTQRILSRWHGSYQKQTLLKCGGPRRSRRLLAPTRPSHFAVFAKQLEGMGIDRARRICWCICRMCKLKLRFEGWILCLTH